MSNAQDSHTATDQRSNLVYRWTIKIAWWLMLAGTAWLLWGVIR